MQNQSSYDIHLDVKFPSLEKIDVKAYTDSVEPWHNQTLTRVNDCVVRVGVLHGEFHWHKHDEEDEYFQVMEGTLLIDIEEGNRSIELKPMQGFMVPKGVVHRTRAPERCVVLMIEGAGVVPTGD